MLTREERLITMKGADLIRVADKYGVKVNCNKSRTQLKESKDAVIARILAIENQIKAPEVNTAETQETKAPEIKAAETSETPGATVSEANVIEATETETPKAAETKTRETKGRAATNVIFYKGKTQSIKDWGKELGIPYHTLYDRIKRNGWTIEEALETPLGGRRPK